MLQILLCLMCPLLIPWLITFDRSTGMPLFHNRVAPLSKKDAAKEEQLIVRTKRQLCHMCDWFICSRVIILLLYTGRLFYKAPVVKFCCHSVTMQFTRTDNAAFRPLVCPFSLCCSGASTLNKLRSKCSRKILGGSVLPETGGSKYSSS